MQSMCAEIFFINVHLWHLFSFLLSLSLLPCLSSFCCSMPVAQLTWLGSQMSEKAIQSQNFSPLNSNESSSECSSPPCQEDVYNDIFIPEYWQRWPWGLGHWDSSSTEQRTMLCWDGSFSHSGTHLSHCLLVLSTAWYNADAVSPEHAGCFYCRRLCWLQLDHFPGERGALPTGKAVCCVICCLPKQTAAHVGPSLLETETWDII